MLDAMELRPFAQRTREAYLHWAIELARHTHTAPDQLVTADLETFILHLLRERHLAPATCAQALQALRFLWCVVLKRPDIVVDLPSPIIPQRLPLILSRAEVARILDAACNLRNRVVLMTTYAAGLRVSEVCHLRVADIDSERMALRVEQGKGARDRYSLLPPQLLEALRLYWRAYRPQVWLFPSRRADIPVDISLVQKWFYAARDKAGVSKRAASTACATPSPPICWKPGSICAPSRACWATATSARRCATCIWPSPAHFPSRRARICWTA